MTLWDWFAGQALAGLSLCSEDMPARCAQAAAQLADGMMAERAKRSAMKPPANCKHAHVDSQLGRFPYCIDCGAEL